MNSTNPTINHCACNLSSTPPKPNHISTIVDTDYTGHFLLFSSPCTNQQPATHDITTPHPVNPHTCLLDLPHLSEATHQAHIFPELASSALSLSISLLCDHRCDTLAVHCHCCHHQPVVHQPKLAMPQPPISQPLCPWHIATMFTALPSLKLTWCNPCMSPISVLSPQLGPKPSTQATSPLGQG
jgi:hypothetical protein